MRIDNQEYLIIHYFQLNGKDYVIYTLDDSRNVIYLSLVNYYEEHIELNKIQIKDIKKLKKIVEIFLTNENDNVYFRENNYRSLLLKQLTSNKIILNDCILIKLKKEQYKHLITKKK